MPESDEDYERRNREKFARERDYGDRSRGRDFIDRTRRDFSNGGSVKRIPTRREDEFPAKRNRFDSASDSFEPQFNRSDENASPVLLTFKKFLATQDESITDDEAIAKYMEYKLDFKKQELDKYFQQHKSEEWFRFKYHPEESKQWKEESQNFVKRRLEVFNSFLENGLIDKTDLNYLNAANIIRLMDAVVVKLEGGSDEAVAEIQDETVEDDSVTEIAKLKENDLAVGDDASKPNEIKNVIKAESSNGEAVEKNGNNFKEDGENKETNKDVTPNENANEASKRKKSHLHKTCSIYFKSIPTTAKVSELENLCKQHPGFLRIGLTDPLAESKNQRHGWVTYRRDVNIKEIFWSLKSAKLNGSDLGAVVNRDLKRRVRAVNGVTVDRAVVQNDIQNASKLIALYDHKAKVFVLSEEEQAPLEDLERAVIESTNPVLSGVSEYLIEEASAEEDALLGVNGELNNHSAKRTLEVDNEMLKVLDRLLWYLRIVHSVDYYNSGEYLNEDLMPNRIGIIHVRGLLPKDESIIKTENSTTSISKRYVDDYISEFNQRLTSSLLKSVIIAPEELVKLGSKDAEKAVSDFISMNCVEVAKDKWLCPLSGKKFKGPEFIQKHLQSKHQEKLNEVRDEVLYFNNYLADPQRPQNPEPKPPASSTAIPLASVPQPTPLFGEGERRFDDHRPGGYRNNWNGGNPRYSGGGGMNRGFGGRDFGGGRPRYFDPSGSGSGPRTSGGGMDNGVQRDPRQPVTYKDLDAPDESSLF